MIREDVVSALAATGKWSTGTARLFERAELKCEYCDYDLLASIEAYKQLEVDHIVPLSKGGDPAEFDNLAITCRHCNFHLKKAWDPRNIAGQNATRNDLVKAVRSYVKGLIQPRIEDLQNVRRIVGYKQVG